MKHHFSEVKDSAALPEMAEVKENQKEERSEKKQELTERFYDLFQDDLEKEAIDNADDRSSDAYVGDGTDELCKEDNQWEAENAEQDMDEFEGLLDFEIDYFEMKEETGWPDDIIDEIGSKRECEVYMDAGLQPAVIGEKWGLIRNDIDWSQKDAMGRTNKERAANGLAPIHKDGTVIELHHIGQHEDSPLAELTMEVHRGKSNYAILHDATKKSEIDRTAFAGEKSAHWKARAEEGGDKV